MIGNLEWDELDTAGPVHIKKRVKFLFMFNVKDLPEIMDFDLERIEIAKKRQAALWKGEKPDKWPIGIFNAPLTKEQEAIFWVTGFLRSFMMINLS